LHRSPHRYPAGDGQTFTRQIEKRAVFLSRERVARQQAEPEEKKSNREADPALPQQSFQLEPAQFGPVGEIIVHALFHEVRRIRFRQRLIYMDAQKERIAPMKFLGPTDNEFFGVMIEVPFVKRRRIHRIKKLLHPIHKNLDPMLRSPSSRSLSKTGFEIESHGFTLFNLEQSLKSKTCFNDYKALA
jgi:hypothetical protein